VQGPIGGVVALVLFGWLVRVSHWLRPRVEWELVAKWGVRALAFVVAVTIIVVSLAFFWVQPVFYAILGIGAVVGATAWLGIPLWFLLVGRVFAYPKPASGRSQGSSCVWSLHLATTEAPSTQRLPAPGGKRGRITRGSRARNFRITHPRTGNPGNFDISRSVVWLRVSGEVALIALGPVSGSVLVLVCGLSLVLVRRGSVSCARRPPVRRRVVHVLTVSLRAG
jgi:hypothetical protein